MWARLWETELDLKTRSEDGDYKARGLALSAIAPSLAFYLFRCQLVNIIALLAFFDSHHKVLSVDYL